jgi:hypothetical protein
MYKYMYTNINLSLDPEETNKKGPDTKKMKNNGRNLKSYQNNSDKNSKINEIPGDIIPPLHTLTFETSRWDIYIYMHICVCNYICIYVYIYICIYISVTFGTSRLDIYIYTNIYMCVYINLSIYIDINIYIYMYIHMYIYIYI